jgi:hypothetical protein
MSATPATSLVGCAKKYARAKFHFDDLQRQRVKFIKEMNPYRAGMDEIVEIDANTAEFVYHLTDDVIKPPGDEWGPIIGDIGHNLMSCLDHLAMQLSILNGGDPDRAATEFPIFAEDNSKTQSQISNDICTLAVDDQRRIRDLQPYVRGNLANEHPLWLLRQLNIIDKHRRPLLSTTGMYDLETLVVHEVQGLQVVSHTISDGTKAGDEVLRLLVKRTGSDEPKINVGTVVHIEFGPGTLALEGRSIITVLHDAATFIHDKVFPEFAHRVGPLPPI